MIILYLVLLLILCAFICLFQAFIHETGHYLCIKKWAGRLDWNVKDTYIIIGDENAKVIFKIGIYRIMSRGYLKKGNTVSSFYKKLAVCENNNKIKIIKENTLAGVKAIILTGLLYLVLLFIIFMLNIGNITPLIFAGYFSLSIIAGVLISFIAHNSFGAGNKYSDFYFWNDPQSFIGYFNT